MSVLSRINYYRRLFPAYLACHKSQLTFWHEVPEVNPHFSLDRLGEYYMLFFSKANYSGYYDVQGVPLLNYHGKIGLQYNPIAIAQYGLGNYNLYMRNEDLERRSKFLKTAEWLVDNLQQNAYGVWVWNHHFDWEYRQTLKAPWYSGLAQGQGISVLVRANAITNQRKYLDFAERAFGSFLYRIDDGGVIYVDKDGNIWIEEYIVNPPTHILNGFIWALWGVYDYYLATRNIEAKNLFEQCTHTIIKNIHRYDASFWSLYDLSSTKMNMLASPFYHNLHIVQLQVMYTLTKEQIFHDYALKWEKYKKNFFKRTYALAYKSLFKLFYY